MFWDVDPSKIWTRKCKHCISGLIVHAIVKRNGIKACLFIGVDAFGGISTRVWLAFFNQRSAEGVDLCVAWYKVACILSNSHHDLIERWCEVFIYADVFSMHFRRGMIDLTRFKSIKAIVFDLDGVLVDSRHLHYDALNAALAEIDDSYVITVEEHLAKYDGLPTNKKLNLLTEEKGLPRGFHVDVWKRKQEMTVELIRRDVGVDLELRWMLEKLKSMGLRLFCASNSVSLTLNEMLRALGVLELFEKVYSNEDVMMTKPHPNIYLKVMCDNGLAPCEVVIVEDSPIGRVAGTLSGGHVCAVSNPECVRLGRILEAVKVAEEKNKKMVIDTRWQNDIQVVIPMAGLGSRFAVKGFVKPKPFIDVGGKPMIPCVIENMNLPGARFLFVVRKEHVAEWGPELEKYAPGCVVVETPTVTAGPACTVMCCAKMLDMDKPLLIANSDQFLEWDANAFLYQSQNVDGCISVFRQEDLSDKKWSYCALGEDGMVQRVAEKEVISEWASTGIYYWHKAGDFVKYTRHMIDAEDRVNNEFYVCPVYNWAIQDGCKIKVVECKKMWGLGVPEDLEVFKREFLHLGTELR